MIETQYIDHGRAAIEAAVAKLKTITLTIGFQGKSGLAPARLRKARQVRRKSKTGRTTRFVESRIRTVDLATIHEFGSAKARIPERSFLRATMRNNQAAIAKMNQVVVRAALKGQDPVPAAVRVGLRLEAAVKRTITELRTPPLARSTIRKRFALTGDADPNPLVDTGHLRNSVSYVVRVGTAKVEGDD